MSASDSDLRFAAALPCGNLEPPPAFTLRAGDLTLLYEAGAVRYVRRGTVEIVRMVYAAVRDEHWLTIPGRIENERVTQNSDGFVITYECHYEREPIAFHAAFRIEGTPDGRLSLMMHGTAQTDFLKNRIGFCILHPIAECAGQECVITAPDGSETGSRFPDLIAPHQPFLNMQAMRWNPSPDISASLAFTGDIFETEDQRNWTDASYKTYSTPLSLPYPVAIKAGETVRQGVELHVSAPSGQAAEAFSPDDAADRAVRFAPTGEPERPLPPIGMNAAGRFAAPDFALELTEIAAVRAPNFSHLRVEAHLYRDDWQTNWKAALREAALFHLPLSVAAFFGDAPEPEAEALRDALRQTPTPVVSLLLLHRDRTVLPDALAASLLPAFRAALPNVPLGIGTDRHFTELNRNRPAAALPFDFLCYSANPQVHAADTRSLAENLAAQAETVRSVRAFGGKRSVHVAPVTLKRRYLDATGDLPASLPGELPWNVDTRQMSLFGAGWTLVSVKYLAEARADRLTYGEIAGMRGLFLPRNAPVLPAFPTPPGAWFPAYWMWRELLSDLSAVVVPWRSSDPLRVDGMALRSPDMKKPLSPPLFLGVGAHFQDSNLRLLLANLTAEPQSVEIAASTVRAAVLDAEAVQRTAFAPSDFSDAAIAGAWKTAKKGDTILTLPPYALASLEIMEAVSA